MRTARIALAALLALAFLTASSARAQCDTTKLKPLALGFGDLFGTALAVRGDSAAVGSPYWVYGSWSTGAVWTYERQLDGSWSEDAMLLAADAHGGMQFGGALAMSDLTLAVGADHESASGINGGAVYVFDLIGGAWVQGAKLRAGDPQPAAYFGSAVALSDERVLVGAPLAESAPWLDSGAAYVFKRQSGGEWEQEAKLVSSDGAKFDLFGSAVAWSGDLALVGAPGDDSEFFNAGSVYVFERAVDGWIQVAKLEPHGPGGTFGISLAASGSTLVVGARYEAGPSLVKAGVVHVFQRIASGQWVAAVDLVPPHPQTFDEFGASLAIEGDRIAVGAPEYDSSDIGAVFVFRAEADQWGLEQTYLAPDPEANDALGSAVALHGHGALATAPYDDDPEAAAGALYVFEEGVDAPLVGCPTKLSLASGGTQFLALAAGAEHAAKLYLLLGTSSGTSPGLPLDGLVLLLNPDAYFQFTLANPNQPPLAGSLGILASGGTGSSAFVLPPATDPSLAGLTLHHAAVVVPLPALAPVQFVSNAASVVLKP